LVSHIEGKHRLRVFENRVLRITCGLTRDEEIGSWRKLYSDLKACNLYMSLYFIMVTKSRRLISYSTNEICVFLTFMKERNRHKLSYRKVMQEGAELCRGNYTPGFTAKY
jgi:hypothetical protein